jgi:hypothetical protein
VKKVQFDRVEQLKEKKTLEGIKRGDRTDNVGRIMRKNEFSR